MAKILTDEIDSAVARKSAVTSRPPGDGISSAGSAYANATPQIAMV
jgi:hypothetical protein